MTDPFTVCLVCKEAMRRSALTTHACLSKPAKALETDAASTVKASGDGANKGSPPKPCKETGRGVTTVQNTRNNARQTLAASPPPRTPPEQGLPCQTERRSGGGVGSAATSGTAGRKAAAVTASDDAKRTPATEPRIGTLSERARSASIHSVEPQPPRIRISLSQESTPGSACERRSSHRRSLDVDELVPYQLAHAADSSGANRVVAGRERSPSSEAYSSARRIGRSTSALSSSSASPMPYDLRHHEVESEESPQRQRESLVSSVSSASRDVPVRSTSVSTPPETRRDGVLAAQHATSRSNNSSRRGSRQLELSPPITNNDGAAPDPSSASRCLRRPSEATRERSSSSLPVDPYERFCAQLSGLLTPEVRAALARQFGSSPNKKQAQTPPAECTRCEAEQQKQSKKIDALTVELHALRQWRREQEAHQTDMKHQMDELRRSLDASTVRARELGDANEQFRSAIAALTEHGEAMVAAHQDVLVDVRDNCTVLQKRMDDILGSANRASTANLEARDRVWAKELRKLEAKLEVLFETVAASTEAQSSATQPPTQQRVNTSSSSMTEQEPRDGVHGGDGRAFFGDSAPGVSTRGAGVDLRSFTPPLSPYSAVQLRRPMQRERPGPASASTPRAASPPMPASALTVFSDIALIKSPAPRVPSSSGAPSAASAAPPYRSSTSADRTSLPREDPNHFSRGPFTPQRTLTDADRVLEKLTGPPTVVIPHSTWMSSGNVGRTNASLFPR